MRIAVISDIHGNALALEAVLEDIAAHNVDTILNLGDHFYGPLDPGRTARILAGVEMTAILGNTDRYFTFTDPDGIDPDERAMFDALPQSALDWLWNLPSAASYEDQILLAHGTPSSDEVYWLDRKAGKGFRLATDLEIEAELPPRRFPLYCCGHTHIARIVTLPDGRIVFNPGSVGRPSFNMSDPYSASRAAPDAAYALLTLESGQWQIDLRQVPYDHHAASALALANGSPEWANDLMHGRRR